LIPFFNQLLTIVSSLFSVWLTYGSAGIIWFWDQSPLFRGYARDENERRMDTRKKWCFGAISILVVGLVLLQVVGRADHSDCDFASHHSFGSIQCHSRYQRRLQQGYIQPSIRLLVACR
jgi:hypothetical protein